MDVIFDPAYREQPHPIILGDTANIGEKTRLKVGRNYGTALLCTETQWNKLLTYEWDIVASEFIHSSLTGLGLVCVLPTHERVRYCLLSLAGRNPGNMIQRIGG